MKKLTKSRKIVNRAFHEIHENQPKVVLNTIGKYGIDVGKKQRVAIALTKARDKGAKIPRRKM